MKNIAFESLDELKEWYVENDDGMDGNVSDKYIDMNQTVLEPMAISEFLASLIKTDK